MWQDWLRGHRQQYCACFGCLFWYPQFAFKVVDVNNSYAFWTYILGVFFFVENRHTEPCLESLFFFDMRGWGSCTWGKSVSKSDTFWPKFRRYNQLGLCEWLHTFCIDFCWKPPYIVFTLLKRGVSRTPEEQLVGWFLEAVDKTVIRALRAPFQSSFCRRLKRPLCGVSPILQIGFFTSEFILHLFPRFSLSLRI